MNKKRLFAAMLMFFASQHTALAGSLLKPANHTSAEAEVRSFTSALLYVTPEGKWQIGPDNKHLVDIHYANFTKITDDTFNLIAINAEKSNTGGYVLFLENATTGDMFLANLDATGNALNYKVLTTEEIFQAEKTYNVDLNLNGGIGSEAVIYNTGTVNIYLSGDGTYQLGKTNQDRVTITVGGKPLTDLLLPENWEIEEAIDAADGFRVFLTDANANVYNANVNRKGEFTGGKFLTDAELEALEDENELDINSDSNTAAPEGWENTLKSPYLKNILQNSRIASKRVNAKTATQSTALDYPKVVALLQTIIDQHQDNSPLTDEEINDLRTIARRGKAAFVSKSTDGASSDYLAYVFDKLVNESVANNFWTGGGNRVALGNLTSGTRIDNFKKLVDKWILGKDLPSTKTAGDSANPKASGAEPAYAAVNGPLFIDGITQADIAQGSLGDCYLVASVIGVADLNPARIKAMIVENEAVDGNRTWGVRFYDNQGKAHWVTVNDMLPVEDSNNPQLKYGANQEKLTTGEIWWPLIEKAYVQANTLQIIGRTGTQIGQNAFWAIEGGSASPLGNISGKEPSGVLTTNAENSENPLAPDDLKQTILTALETKQPVWIGSDKDIFDAAGKKTFAQGHAFILLNSASNANEITIRNPWTLSTAGDDYLAPFKISLDELVRTPTIDFQVGKGF